MRVRLDSTRLDSTRLRTWNTRSRCARSYRRIRLYRSRSTVPTDASPLRRTISPSVRGGEKRETAWDGRLFLSLLDPAVRRLHRLERLCSWCWPSPRTLRKFCPWRVRSDAFLCKCKYTAYRSQLLSFAYTYVRARCIYAIHRRASARTCLLRIVYDASVYSREKRVHVGVQRGEFSHKG